MKRSLSEYEGVIPVCKCGYLCELKYQKGMFYTCPSSSKRCKFAISKFKWDINKIKPKEISQVGNHSGTYYLPRDIWKVIVEYLPIGYSFKILPLLNKSWKSIIDVERRKERLFAEIEKTFGSQEWPPLSRKANFVILKTMYFSFVDTFLTMCVGSLRIRRNFDEHDVLFDNALFSEYDVLLDCVRADSKQIFNKIGNSYLGAVAMKGSENPNFASPAVFRVEIEHTALKHSFNVFKLDELSKLRFPSVNFANKQYYLLIVDKKSELYKYKCNTISIQSLKYVLQSI